MSDVRSLINAKYKVEKDRIPFGDNAGTLRVAEEKETGRKMCVLSLARKEIPNGYPLTRVMQGSEYAKSLGKHDNIAEVTDAFLADNFVYIAQEWFTGGDLMDKLIECGRQGVVTSRYLVNQVARAIEHLHANNYVHTDLRLENILLEQPAKIDKAVLKVLIQCHLIRKVDDVNYGVFAERRGFPTSSSPEMLLDGEFTMSTDIWSLGVIAHTIISGYPPFCNVHPEANISAMSRDRQVKLRPKDWHEISKSGQKLVLRMLGPPQNRPKIQQILEDPWFSGAEEHMPPEPPEIDPEEAAACNLASLKKQVTLRETTIQTLATGLTAKQLLKLGAVWKELDDSGADAQEDSIRHCRVTDLRHCLLDKRVDAAETLDQLAPILNEAEQSNTSFGMKSEDLVAACSRRRWSNQEEACWEIFQIFDADGSGFIDKQEIQAAFNNPQIAAVKDGRLEKILHEAARKPDTHINYEEFVRLVRGKAADDKYRKVKLAFKMYDRDKNGMLSESEFIRVFRSLNKTMSEESARKLFGQVDHDANGEISLEDFISWLEDSGMV
eukprot:TRINITY_DN109228_c0_g1_i1.p1 TRINITY_DN109228_c0_g1~~TRINITY_DN109228_c0_g1_i1.p1  ORF type:complete len:553 (+),score=99.45 TRINITY_DN109228_c0_g1_i1:157-1815(+)